MSHAAFSPSGTTLAASADDGTLRLWDSSTGEELAALPMASALPVSLDRWRTALRGVSF